MTIHAQHVRHMDANKIRHSPDLLAFAAAQDARLSVGAIVGVKANGTLTLGATPSDTQTVTIGSKVYTFQTTLTEADGHVHIGASATTAATNLFNAINKTGGGTAGTDYANATTANADVVATNPVATHVLATEKTAGVAGNAKATTSTVTSGTWSHTTLTGGVDAASAVPFDTLASLKRGNSADEIRAASVATALK